MDIYAIIGYIGSFLIAASLTMNNILRLRWINLFGASTFATYGALIGAYPVLVLNGFITLVDIYYLWQMYHQKDYFTLSPSGGAGDCYLNKFLDYYKDDLNKLFPTFDRDKHQKANYYFILRNMNPAGLFVYEEISNDTINILLDYATPNYRDLKNAKFLYFTADFMQEKGYRKLITESPHKLHQGYLKTLGFEKVNNNTFVKKID